MFKKLERYSLCRALTGAVTAFALSGVVSHERR